MVWRAGELRIRAAEPLIWCYLRGEKKPPKIEPPPPSSAGPMPTWSPWALTADRDADPPASFYRLRYGRRSTDNKKILLLYSAAWALGRCGTAESIPRLRAFATDPGSPTAARRIALESIRLLMTPEERAETARRVLEGLDPGLAAAARSGRAGEFRDRLVAAVDEAGGAGGRGDDGGECPRPSDSPIWRGYVGPFHPQSGQGPGIPGLAPRSGWT